MELIMKEIELETAILSAIIGFKGQKFSIWNITSKIRDDVNTLKYLIVKLGTSIIHGDVRAAFEELVDKKLLTDYVKTYNSAGFNEYQHVDYVNQSLVDIGYTKTALPAKVKLTVDDITNACNTSGIPTDVQKKMYLYIKNNGPVTMKQIQSRLKAPYTCQQIKDFLSKIYLIDPNTSSNPNSQVKTVRFN